MKKTFFFAVLLFSVGSIYAIDFEKGFSIIGLGWNPFLTHAGVQGKELMFGRTINGIEYFETKDTGNISLNDDGFYTTSIFGDECVILAGGNYFFFHDVTDARYSMFRTDMNFHDFYNRHTDYSEPYYGIIGERRRSIKNIAVPDTLIENTAAGQIHYSPEDMLKYYARMLDANVVCNPDAKPWATGKEPIGMSIVVEFDTPYSMYRVQYENQSDHIVVLNGYVNPLKRHLFKANRRVKSLQIESLDDGVQFNLLVPFDDTAEFKRIQFPSSVSKVKLTILDYYEGSRYKDLCIQMIGTDFDMDSGVNFIARYKGQAVRLPSR